MKVFDYVIKFLIQHGTDNIFGYIGGNNAHLFDSIDKYKMIEIVSSRHEQTAVLTEEDYARMIGRTNGTSNVKAGLKIYKLRKKFICLIT